MHFKNYIDLREVLDNIPDNLPVKWHPQPHIGNYADKYVAYFTVNNTQYYAAFSKAVQFPSKQRSKKGLYGYYVIWDMYRGQGSASQMYNSRELDDDLDPKDKENTWWNSNFKRTHKGDANIKNTLEVLRYVLGAMLVFVTELKPALISYRPSDKNLSKLYTMFASKHAERLGYHFYGRHLVRKDIIKDWGPQLDWFLKNADTVV